MNIHRQIGGSGGGGGKGGGGGGSQREAVEAPNTLRSRSTARFIDLLSEGPIVGLINGQRSIFLDDTPIQNPNGTINFAGISYETREGLTDQAHLAGFPAVETEVGVGAEVKASIPVVRTVTNLDADAIRVTVRIPGLLSTDTSTGDINPTSVRIAIDVAPEGGSFATLIDDTISGKTTSPYERAYRIPLSGTGPWQVRMRRVTADSEAATLQNDTFFASFTTIVDFRLTYPDSALVGVTVDAQAFGSNVPRRSYDVQGLIVQVPTNYNPVTRAYDGIWDGTFKEEWTDNPAWVFYDLATNARYGLGEFLDSRFGLSEPDKWELYEIAQYCDELVPDGFGGQEPRYTFNGVIANREEALKVLAGVAGVFRGMMFLASGSLFVSADRPADPVKLVTPANVVGGDLNYSGFGLSTRHSVALVTWNDPRDGFRPTIEVVEDPEAIERYGWKDTEVIAVGCTSRGQAHRVGRWILESERSESELITYTASFDHADVEPGQYISVQDEAYAGIRFGGRIAGIAENEAEEIVGIAVDDAVTLEAGQTYQLAVVMPDGTIAERPLANAPGSTTTITFDEPLAEMPVAGAMWVLTASNLAPRPYRVVTSRESGKNLFEITATFHDKTKYARIEQDLVLEPPVFSLFPTGALLQPSNLGFAEYLYLAGGVAVRNAVTLSWSAPNDPRVSRYEAQFRAAGLDWQFAGLTSGVSLDILDFGSGVFDFRVRAVSDITGSRSPWVEINAAAVLGILAPPGDVQNFRISVLGDMATLTWTPVATLNLSHYEIRFSSAVSGVTWGSAVQLLDDVTGASIQVPAMVGTYLIKSVTQQDVSSLNASLIISKVAKFANFNVVELLTEDPEFFGAKDGVTFNADFAALQLDYAGDVFAYEDWFDPADWFLGTEGLGTEGIYTFAQSIDLGHVYTSRLSAQIAAFGVNLTDDVFARFDWFEAEDFFGDDPALWDVTVEYRATNDDPTGTPDWSEWESLVIGDVTARAYEFRAILRGFEFGVTPFITGLSAEVDMPDRVLSGEDIAVSSDGLRIDFEPAYLALKGVAISAQGLATGDRYEITNKDERGFYIRFFTSGGTPIARTFDYVSQGYGREED